MNISKMITVAAVAASAMAANAATVTTNGVTWTYTVNNATAKTVTLGDGSSTYGNAIGGTGTSAYAADIPWKFISESDGEVYTVTKIGQYAFRGCTKLTGNLAIPSSVTDIGVHAFYSCTGLTGLKLGPNVTTIGSWAFLFCENMVFDLSELASVTSFPMGNSQYGPFDAGNKSKEGSWKSKCFGHARFHPNLTGISSCMFRGVPVTGITLPESLTSIKDAAFAETKLKALWLKGSANLDIKYCFGATTPLEIFFAGPNTTCSNPNVTSAKFTDNAAATFKVFMPATGNWLNLYTANAPGVEKIYYGPGRGVDISVNTARNELTATPTNATRLVTMLEAAPLFREHFGLDTRISVTNAIDLSGVTITPAMTSAVTFDRLLFKVNTQTQLNAILNAFPASAPLAIDPSDITENLVVPATRKVFVQLSEADAVRLKVKGLMVIVK